MFEITKNGAIVVCRVDERIVRRGGEWVRQHYISEALKKISCSQSCELCKVRTALLLPSSSLSPSPV
jgi:hypothetical protein